MKTKAVITLTILFMIYCLGTYCLVSIGNKSFDYHEWSADGGTGFGLLSLIGMAGYLVLLSKEIKIIK